MSYNMNKYGYPYCIDYGAETLETEKWYKRFIKYLWAIFGNTVIVALHVFGAVLVGFFSAWLVFSLFGSPEGAGATFALVTFAVLIGVVARAIENL